MQISSLRNCGDGFSEALLDYPLNEFGLLASASHAYEARTRLDQMYDDACSECNVWAIWRARDPITFLESWEMSPEDEPAARPASCHDVRYHQGTAPPPRHLARKTVEFARGVTAEFVYIDAPSVAPEGFVIGSPAAEEGRDDDEAQFRAVLTVGYWMQTTEVTQGQWQAMMGSNPSHFQNGMNYPVEMVTWEDCQRYISMLRQRGLAARLPTEAEWEFACRAATTTPFSFGATISTDKANYDGNFVYGSGPKGIHRGKTTPVGAFPANAWGLYDMHGNVWEWCSDWYGEYPETTTSDPTGSQASYYSHRVLRGGSWIKPPAFLRSAYRHRFARTCRSLDVGFRLALDLD